MVKGQSQRHRRLRIQVNVICGVADISSKGETEEAQVVWC